jgi:MFS family permease
MIVAESAFFVSALSWVDPAAVLPLFIAHLTPSTLVIGVIAVLLQVGWKLPQIFMAAALGHRPRRLPFLRWPVLIGRLPFLAFVVYLWLRGIENGPQVIWFLAIGYAGVALGNGVLGVSWNDIIAKSIPSWLRGRFFGMMNFSAMGMAFLVGFAVRWILGPGGPGFPHGYIVLFTMMGVFLTISIIGCWLVREPIRPVLAKPQSVWELFAGLIPLLRDKRFRWLVVTALLGFGAMSTMPFYVVFAKQRLGVPDEMGGVYIWGMAIGGALASLFWGHLNDRRGPRAVLRGVSFLVAATPLLAMGIAAVLISLAELGPAMRSALPYVFGLVFVVGGSTMGAMWIGTTTYLFELCGHEDRPRYIASFHFCTLPGALGALGTGWLLSFLSFSTVFVLLALGGATMVAAALRLPHIGQLMQPAQDHAGDASEGP